MKKIPVAILGATGMVGQRFIELLSNHPWFEIVGLAASDLSAGKKLKNLVHLQNSYKIDPSLLEMEIQSCNTSFDCPLVFSALDSKVAYNLEKNFQDKGYTVISNARNHRMDEKVPLLIPEVNPEHLDLIKLQKQSGKIITNPNCSTIGLCLALKPLEDLFGIDSLHVTTLQAISGAGYPGVPSQDILDNVIPYIDGEEEKIQTETLKILGTLENSTIKPSSIRISAQCNRVAVQDGHLECVSIKLKRKASLEEMINAFKTFQGLPQILKLPSAPKFPIIYHEQNHAPQPKFHRMIENGMAVSVGRVRPCPLFDYKFAILSHNTIRGAAGSTILIGELMHKQGLIK